MSNLFVSRSRGTLIQFVALRHATALLRPMAFTPRKRFAMKHTCGFTHFVIDVEADGPAPGLFSMVSFATVIVERPLNRNHLFFSTVRPISDAWDPEALAVSGYHREEMLLFPSAEGIMPAFATWVRANTAPGCRPVFWADNNGFDWHFINYYLWRFVGENVFGHSSRNISDVFFGLTNGTTRSLSCLQNTPHTHHPTDDALGKAEALLAMCDDYGLNLAL